MASYVKYAISSGHGLYVRGAGSYIDEVDEARKVVKQVTKLLKERGCTVKEIHDDVSKTKAQNITNGRSSYLVKQHNGANREIDISVHFNAIKKQDAPVGTEVLYINDNMKSVASELSKAIADAGGFKNRGAKKRTDLAFLKCTDKPALLLEVCFVDSKADTDLYKKNFDKICEAIAKCLSGKSAPVKKPATTTTTFKVGSYQKDVITTDNLNARSGRGTEHKVLGTFPKGTKVNVWYIDKAKDGSLWGSCSYNGKTAYISMKYVKKA